jgi:uncharacterized protein YpmS
MHTSLGSPMRRLLVLLVLLLPTFAVSPAADDTPIEVQVQMRNVRLHVDEATVLQVARLRGALVSTKGGHPPVFDDKHSFIVRIDSAQIALSMDSLTRLLNTYVFHYDGSPLKNLTVTADGSRLKLKGTVHKGIDLPFTIVADPSVDADGALRLRAHSIKTLGIPAKGLLAFFGVELENLVNLHGRTGMRVVEDTVVLAPGALVPPPRIEGRLQAVRVEPTRVVQIFGPGSLPPLKVPDRSMRNYMYYRGGTLRFGKLTMSDADLALIDANQKDAFDFYQDRYERQLVAGYSKNTLAHGLKVYMPDYYRVR